MAGVASLGMYDSDALRTANDRLWTAIATRLAAAGVSDPPPNLDRTRSLDAIWDDPDLILAQTCGYPWLKHRKGRLRYVATPRYRAVGCEGVKHRSRLVVRLDDEAPSLAALRGQRAAVNDPNSNTGMNLLRAAVAPLAHGHAFFAAVIETGSHAASAEAVAEGAADIAAIDTVTFAHLQRERPELSKRLRTLAWTTETPNLPFVTAGGASNSLVRKLRAGIARAIDDDREAADILLLDGIEVIGARAYNMVLSIEGRAARAGYPQLA